MPRNNVGKQKRLDPRRRDFYKLRMNGKTVSEAADIICKSYNAKKRALYQDWEHRDEWGDYVIPEDEDKFLVQDALNRINDLRDKMHEIIKDPRATIAEKIKAIKALMTMELKVIDAYQSLGKVHREATTIRIEEEVERLNQIVTEVAGDDPIAQENLMRVILRYAESESSDN